MKFRIAVMVFFIFDSKYTWCAHMELHQLHKSNKQHLITVRCHHCRFSLVTNAMDMQS